jgi:pyrroline-5-carboxylate reductase
MPRIAFIGSGRMASAMVGGILAGGATPGDLACIGGDDDTAQVLAGRTGIRAASDLPDLLKGADIVVLACKPQQLAGLDTSLAKLTASRLVLSILAGKRLERLEQTFPSARNLVRAMPNTPGQIAAGVTAWAAHHPPESADRKAIKSILGSLGKVIEVEENLLDAVTALSGSGPAFLFEFVAALREGGIAAGLPPKVAATLAQETVLGSARLLAQSGESPETLRDQVTSPNGTTFAGLQRMTARDFRGLVRETLIAARDRSIELSKD